MAKKVDKYNDKNQYSYKRRRTNKRVLVKKEGSIAENAESGRIIMSIGRYYVVRGDSDKENAVECVLGGAVVSQNESQSLASVGDYVKFIRNKNKKDLGKIVKIEERKKSFARKDINSNIENVTAANVDFLLIFVSTKKPKYNRRFIDRLLVAAELNLIKPIVCVNKIDLADTEEIRKDFSIYENLGVSVYFLSALKNIGTKEVLVAVGSDDAVMVGPSGVGKSTFLNNVLGGEFQKVKEISEKTGKGKHATTHVQMFRTPYSGALIDTPGLREFAIWGLDKNELSLYFHDFDDYREDCRFSLCTHTHEPDCAVKKAVEEEKIDPERYQSYVNIFDSLD